VALKFLQLLVDTKDELSADFEEHVMITKNKVSRFGNSYIMLTSIGFIPSVVSCLSYVSHPIYPCIVLVVIISINTIYIVIYSVVYGFLFQYFRSKIDGFMSEDEIYELSDNLVADDKDMNMTDKEIADYFSKLIGDVYNNFSFKRYKYIMKKFKYVTYGSQIINTVLSLFLMLSIIIDEKNDSYNIVGLIQIFITIWLFVINIMLTYIYTINKDRKKKKIYEVSNTNSSKSSSDMYLNLLFSDD
jgi:hypothetical protein